MLYKTCIRIENISAKRVTDPGFWTILLAMWTKNPPSEYHRVEVFSGSCISLFQRYFMTFFCRGWQMELRRLVVLFQGNDFYLRL